MGRAYARQRTGDGRTWEESTLTGRNRKNWRNRRNRKTMARSEVRDKKTETGTGTGDRSTSDHRQRKEQRWSRILICSLDRIASYKGKITRGCMREKRRRSDNTQQEALLIYMRTHTPTHIHATHMRIHTHTHSHASHIRTRTDFSYATEPRTDTPYKIEALNLP